MGAVMGWCHEFGPQISESCEHPITAGATSCSCTVCGVVCTGRFAGCAAVWARGPREVAVDVSPIAGRAPAKVANEFSSGDDADTRWRLPLEPLAKPMSPAVRTPVPAAGPAAAPASPSASGAPTANGYGNGNGVADDLRNHDPRNDDVRNDERDDEHADYDYRTDDYWSASAHDESDQEPADLESPDITARFAVAQLTELNDRVDALTRLATETTAASLERVHGELRRITSQREVDLTEQAAGIFSAVQAGTQALESFAAVVRDVTDDLRAILTESLSAIGGSEGLAASVAEAQADVIGVREDFGAALARIERDLSVMRQRLPAKGAAAAAAKISDRQIDLIVESVTDAVTEAVMVALSAEGRGRRR